ncbi:MAG: hypothetical protein ACXWCS_24330 [Burkholderiales bacterium]
MRLASSGVGLLRLAFSQQVNPKPAPSSVQTSPSPAESGQLDRDGHCRAGNNKGGNQK